MAKAMDAKMSPCLTPFLDKMLLTMLPSVSKSSNSEGWEYAQLNARQMGARAGVCCTDEIIRPLSRVWYAALKSIAMPAGVAPKILWVYSRWAWMQCRVRSTPDLCKPFWISGNKRDS